MLFKKPLFKTKIITGCDAYEQAAGRQSPYLTRVTLLKTRFGNLYFHKFHRSDDKRAMHDHPWSFLSLLLWPGYIEVTPTGRARKYPGMFLYRPAEWVHRVELLPTDCPECIAGDTHPIPYGFQCPTCKDLLTTERMAYSLVWAFKRRREWGFILPSGWMHWRKYFNMQGCDE